MTSSRCHVFASLKFVRQAPRTIIGRLYIASSPGLTQFFNVARRKTRRPGKIDHVRDVEWRELGNWPACTYYLPGPLLDLDLLKSSTVLSSVSSIKYYESSAYIYITRSELASLAPSFRGNNFVQNTRAIITTIAHTYVRACAYSF